MPKDYSPFSPGQPVPIEFFVGRLAEIEKLKSTLAESTSGRLRVAFLSGERGIGKSSLARFVRAIGENQSRALGIHTFLGGVSSLEEMVRRVFDRLLKESVGKTWQGKIKDFFGSHIREVGLFGVSVEFDISRQDLGRMVNDFAPAIRRLIDRLKEDKSGIFLILDDINGLAESEAFANWLKSLVDEIATSDQPLPLFILLVGLEERRQSLISLQPSLARVFDILEIRLWSQQETADFFTDTFQKAGITIEEPALQVLAEHAGGLPVLAHEIGDATFRLLDRDTVDKDTATMGVVIAADIVGRKHLEPQVFNAIHSERYRTILRKLASQPRKMEFRRGDFLESLSSDEKSVFDNFLSKMKSLGVLRAVPDHGPGVYRFSNQLHYTYFWLEALRSKKSPSA